MKAGIKLLGWVLVMNFLGTGCMAKIPTGVQPASPALSSQQPTLTPFQPQPPTAEATSSGLVDTALPSQAAPTAGVSTQPAPAEVPGISVWVDPHLPEALISSLALPPGFTRADRAEQEAIRLEAGNGQPLSQWVYALVAPFPTINQGVSSEELHRAWLGSSGNPFNGQPLLMDEGTYANFSTLWGPAGADAIKVLPAGDLLNYAWNHRPSWGIIPFESLEPRWKVLEVDGNSPLRKEFDPSTYPLSLPVSLDGEAGLVGAMRSLYGPDSASPLVAPANRDPQRMTILAMTGVTALVRATAYTMERQGILYPGRDIAGLLRSADITHISNEVPFAENCPFPNPVQPDMRFCSDPKYIGLLEDVGTDIVELTGDHFQDWGENAMYYTLDMYRQRGWLFYGGGENLEEGRQAVVIEHNGNRLAFIGCNGKGGSYAQAGPKHPGAVKCDYDWLQKEVARLRGEGYLPIVTFQHFEYYTYQAQPDQKRDFRGVSQAGAVVVSGSQAHQPQAFEFIGQNLIHYGLGNLFFDQFDVSLACRQAFIDRHIFYDGRYISTELVPIMFVDYARPRPMTPAERNDLLQTVFGASGW
jgi:hypothetical protein